MRLPEIREVRFLSGSFEKNIWDRYRVHIFHFVFRFIHYRC